MRFPVAVALALVLALGGCGGSGGKDPAPAKTTAKASTEPKAPSGTAAPQDLASFRCAKDGKGRWNALAVVANSTKKSQSYQITVHVGPAEGEQSPARTQSVGIVRAGGSVTVRVLKIPAQADDGPCQVQLLATPA